MTEKSLRAEYSHSSLKLNRIYNMKEQIEVITFLSPGGLTCTHIHTHTHTQYPAGTG